MGKCIQYPLDYDSYMIEAEQSGLQLSQDVKHFIKEIVDLINNAYYQGRFDESLRGGVVNE